MDLILRRNRYNLSKDSLEVRHTNHRKIRLGSIFSAMTAQHRNSYVSNLKIFAKWLIQYLMPSRNYGKSRTYGIYGIYGIYENIITGFLVAN